MSHIFRPFVNAALWHKYKLNPVKESPEHTIKTLDKIPVLLIHGDMDSQTSVKQAKLLYENCSSDLKELWLVKGKDHLIIEDVLDVESDYYREKILIFLRENF